MTRSHMLLVMASLSACLWGLVACQPESAQSEPPTKSYPLPKMGPWEVSEAGDTIYYQVPGFGFVDQDSNLITDEMLQGKVYVVDFFFTTCPTICPKMSQQMVRVHDDFLTEDRLVLISHTIDPAHDSVATLKAYAEALEVQTNRWHLVTGDKDSLYNMARYYMVPAQADESAPGGFIHSGAFILMDGERHVRGFYDGTKPEEVDQLMTDIRWLLAEPKSS